jgi:hypothetical protein
LDEDIVIITDLNGIDWFVFLTRKTEHGNIQMNWIDWGEVIFDGKPSKTRFTEIPISNTCEPRANFADRIVSKNNIVAIHNFIFN